MKKKTAILIFLAALYLAAISIMWVKVSGWAALGLFLFSWASNIERKHA